MAKVQKLHKLLYTLSDPNILEMTPSFRHLNIEV